MYGAAAHVPFRSVWIRCVAMCWKNTCNSPGVWEDWGTETCRAVERRLVCVRLHQNAPAAMKAPPALSFSFLSVRQMAVAGAGSYHGNRSRHRGVFPVWWDLNSWPLPLKRERERERGMAVMDMDLCMGCNYVASDTVWHPICHRLHFSWCGPSYSQAFNDLLCSPGLRLLCSARSLCFWAL